MRPGHVYGRLELSDGRDVLLRALSKNDLAECVRFVNSLVSERSRNPDLGVLLDTRATRKSEGRWLARVVERIGTGDVVSVASFHAGRLVGNCDLRRQPFKDMKHCGELGIAVLEGYRGLGLGRRMLELVLEEAAVAGFSVLELRVLSVNANAIRLYRSLGFRKAGSTPGKVLRGRRRIDEITMFRPI